jgi:hypothetical protein
VQADNYFKVRAGKDSIEFPFVTDYATDAARAEALARDAAKVFEAAQAAGTVFGAPVAVVSVYDSTHFPDYPQVGDWADEDLRDLSEAEPDLH